MAGGLSSNVLNMKFMQRALDKTKEKEKEAEVKKIRDASEWILPNRSLVQKNLKAAVRVQAVGYGSIASLTKESDDEEEIEEKPEPEKVEVCDINLYDPNVLTPKENSKDDAKKFLNSIVGKSKKEKKRKSEPDTSKIVKKKRQL